LIQAINIFIWLLEGFAVLGDMLFHEANLGLINYLNIYGIGNSYSFHTFENVRYSVLQGQGFGLLFHAGEQYFLGRNY